MVFLWHLVRTPCPPFSTCLLTENSDNGSSESQQPLLNTESTYIDYSTTVIRRNSQQPTIPLSSILTIRASPLSQPPPPNRPLPAEPEPASHPSRVSVASYYTASEEASIAAATQGGSFLQVHRFTLVKPGTMAKQRVTSPNGGGGWSALDFFFASGLLPGGGGGGSAKCDICHKRLGRKAALECDDCGLRAHIKCGEVAPRDCGLRAISSAEQEDVSTIPVGGKKNKTKSPLPFSR